MAKILTAYKAAFWLLRTRPKLPQNAGSGDAVRRHPVLFLEYGAEVAGACKPAHLADFGYCVLLRFKQLHCVLKPYGLYEIGRRLVGQSLYLLV